MGWDRNELLTSLVNDVEDGGVATGWQELFNEVEQDRMPWPGWDWELLDKTKGFMSRLLVVLA